MKYERKKDKDFWQMARAFLHDYMPAVRNQSDKSSEAYKQSLNTYLAFLKSEKGIADEKVIRQELCTENHKFEADGNPIFPEILRG